MCSSHFIVSRSGLSVIVTLAVATFTTLCHGAFVALQNGVGVVSENFDGLPSSGSVTWVSEVTVQGWFVSKSLSQNTNINAGTGSSSTSRFYSFGASGDFDRAFGAVSGGTLGHSSVGAFFQNTSATRPIKRIYISYTGEQWRNGGVNANHTLLFSYSTSASGFPAATGSVPFGWTSVSALNFTSPTKSTTASALDGNANANRQVFDQVLLTGATLNPGQQLFIRWDDPANTSNEKDHGLAIDDFKLEYFAANNTTLTLSDASEVDLGRVIVGADNASVQRSIIKAGSDSTTFRLLASGGIVTDLETDTDHVLSAASQTFTAGIDTATPGVVNGTLTLDNRATDSEAAGQGSNDLDEEFTITGTVLDHATASAASVFDLGVIDRGEVGDSVTVTFDNAISNLISTFGAQLTAALDLDSLEEQNDEASKFSDALLSAILLSAGESADLTVTFDTSENGVFSATYRLGWSDEDLAGGHAWDSQELLLTFTGEVIPEPGTFWLLAVASAFAFRRGRVARVHCRA